MSQDFFSSHLGSWVWRTLPNENPRPFFIPNDYRYVSYLHGLQDVGVKFAKYSTNGVCVACEA